MQSWYECFIVGRKREYKGQAASLENGSTHAQGARWRLTCNHLNFSFQIQKIKIKEFQLKIILLIRDFCFILNVVGDVDGGDGMAGQSYEEGAEHEDPW